MKGALLISSTPFIYFTTAPNLFITLFLENNVLYFATS